MAFNKVLILLIFIIENIQLISTSNYSQINKHLFNEEFDTYNFALWNEKVENLGCESECKEFQII